MPIFSLILVFCAAAISISYLNGRMSRQLQGRYPSPLVRHMGIGHGAFIQAPLPLPINILSGRDENLEA
jgi:hypothetical protein